MWKKGLIILFGVIGISLLSGCSLIKPYNTPAFITVESNETAFVVPLVGKTSDQGSFQSEDFLKKAQVATKRIEIPHTWVKTGRGVGTGKWMDNVRVIKVDRSPETREWTANGNGTSKEINQGIQVRSKDGIGFGIGVSATASILEEDSAKFLYMTSGNKTLAQVMDSEVRNRIETKLIESYAKFNMNEINETKGAIMDGVRDDIMKYFKENRGITISNLGYKGDIVFEDAKVQDALNARFTAEQESTATGVRNQTAINTANAQIKVKEAEAKAKIVESEGIAESNRKVSESLSAQLLQKEAIDKWNGQVSQFQGGSSGGGLIIQVPAPGIATAK